MTRELVMPETVILVCSMSIAHDGIVLAWKFYLATYELKSPRLRNGFGKMN